MIYNGKYYVVNSHFEENANNIIELSSNTDLGAKRAYEKIVKSLRIEPKKILFNKVLKLDVYKRNDGIKNKNISLLNEDNTINNSDYTSILQEEINTEKKFIVISSNNDNVRYTFGDIMINIFYPIVGDNKRVAKIFSYGLNVFIYEFTAHNIYAIICKDIEDTDKIVSLFNEEIKLYTLKNAFIDYHWNKDDRLSDYENIKKIVEYIDNNKK